MFILKSQWTNNVTAMSIRGNNYMKALIYTTGHKCDGFISGFGMEML